MPCCNTARPFVPTDFAASLRGPLRQNFESIETLLVSRDDFDPLTCQESFKVSGSDYFAELLMPPLAKLLSRRAPDMKVQRVDPSLGPRQPVSRNPLYRTSGEGRD